MSLVKVFKCFPILWGRSKDFSFLRAVDVYPKPSQQGSLSQGFATALQA